MRRLYSGKSYRCDRPEWGPLVDLLGVELAGDFMWMFEVELEDGPRLQAFKHFYTRGYVHLARDGTAFVYEAPDSYRRYPAADVLAAVFAPMIGLASTTAEQVAASFAAVERLRRQRREAVPRNRS